MSAQVSYNMATKQVRYEALVKALHSDLFRYAYWLCHDKHVAEDLVQETFLRAWRALDSLKDEMEVVYELNRKSKHAVARDAKKRSPSKMWTSVKNITE